jgi:hypothetical protein
MGHFRPSEPVVPNSRCPLRPQSDQKRRVQRNFAKGHYRTHAPQQRSILFDPLVGADNEDLRLTQIKSR